MQLREVSDLHCLFHTQTNHLLSNFGLTSTNHNSPSIHHPFQSFSSTPLTQLQDYNSNPKPVYFLTSDDQADEQQVSTRVINERKQRRMISNRESARRSRIRKQRQLDELWSQVVWLRNENHQLMDKLNHVSEDHDRVIQENTQLKEEACELRQMLCDMQISSPCHGFKEFDDDDLCNNDVLP